MLVVDAGKRLLLRALSPRPHAAGCDGCCHPLRPLHPQLDREMAGAAIFPPFFTVLAFLHFHAIFFCIFPPFLYRYLSSLFCFISAIFVFSRLFWIFSLHFLVFFPVLSFSIFVLFSAVISRQCVVFLSILFHFAMF
jgi:hypothetical protein